MGSVEKPKVAKADITDPVDPKIESDTLDAYRNSVYELHGPPKHRKKHEPDLAGSSFAVDREKDGACIVATNDHVTRPMRGAPRLEMLDGQEYPTKQVFTDEARDIVLLKADVPYGGNCKPVKLLDDHHWLAQNVQVTRISSAPDPSVAHGEAWTYFKAGKKGSTEVMPGPGEKDPDIMMMMRMRSEHGNSGSYLQQKGVDNVAVGMLRIAGTMKIEDKTKKLGYSVEPMTLAIPAQYTQQDLDDYHRGLTAPQKPKKK